MKKRIEITFPEQTAAGDFGDRLVTLNDGRPGVRSTMHVEISEPGRERTLSPSHGERAGLPSEGLAVEGERGPEVAPADRTGPPLPSEGRGIRGEGSRSAHLPLDTRHSSLDSSARQSEATTAQPILDFIASDETLDRCGEIIAADGWRLESYRRNPVFQNAHQYGDIIFTLGRALITEVRSRPLREAPRDLSTIHSPPSTYLFQRIQFATEANPMARIAYALYKGKFLNAVSVGFIPLRWVDADGNEQNSASGGRAASERVPGPHSLSPPGGERVGERGHEPTGDNSGAPLPPTAPARQRGESDGRGVRGLSRHSVPATADEGPFRRYFEQELLEVSAVGIPANPNALQLGLKAGAIQKSDLQELLDLLRSLCASKSGVAPQLSTLNSLARHSEATAAQPIFGSHSAVPNTLAGASGVRSYEAQWLQLAREVRKVMRDA